MSYHLVIAISFILAFIVAFVTTPMAIKLAPRIGALDVPKDERRVHTKAMPRFGGLGIFFGIIVSALLAAFVLIPLMSPEFQDGRITKLAGILVGGVLMYVVGAVDDLKGMPAKLKFACQVVCAAVVWGFGARITFFSNFDGGQSYYLGDVLSFISTILWIVGITNTINLIDGLDGLAAGVAAIASVSITYTAFISEYMFTATIIMISVAGGALGFLPFNFHPARTFMGDGGSLFLGFMLASVSIIGPMKSATVIALIVPVLVLGVPIFDTCFAILRRLYTGRPIMEADKGHLHHRLMAAGMGQKRSVLTLYGISGIMGVAAILFSKRLYFESVALLVISVIFIYILLADAAGSYFKRRGVNTEVEERREDGRRGKKN
ncbi:undecaprenyl-phosphate alpha-N-acetylglucosaminyl 1-phosphate transferase [Clostridia bacterium]|nr:undecaprenyl-phosphate alpha-N-acetylglucosaminyl 1-phosphate transferase [Clostridia bacterium]